MYDFEKNRVVKFHPFISFKYPPVQSILLNPVSV